MVARDRIELPTRGFSVRFALHSANKFNTLASNINGTCITVLNHAQLINAKLTQAFTVFFTIWPRTQFPQVWPESGGY